MNMKGKINFENKLFEAENKNSSWICVKIFYKLNIDVSICSKFNMHPYLLYSNNPMYAGGIREASPFWNYSGSKESFK